MELSSTADRISVLLTFRQREHRWIYYLMDKQQYVSEINLRDNLVERHGPYESYEVAREFVENRKDELK